MEAIGGIVVKYYKEIFFTFSLLYYVIKIFVFIYLFDPKKKGAERIYEKTFRRYFQGNEKSIDDQLGLLANFEKGIILT